MSFFIITQDEDVLVRETRKEVIEFLQHRLDSDYDIEAELDDGVLMIIEGRIIGVGVSKKIELGK